MARLQDGEKNENSRYIYQVMRGHLDGLTEQELAQLLGIQRRTLNNYLRGLEQGEQAYREGRVWHADRHNRPK